MKAMRWWLPGPILAAVVLTWAFAMNVGPGLAAFCILAALAFLILTPLIQFLVLGTETFRGRHGVAAAVGLGVVAVLLVLASASGTFDAW